MRIWEYVGSTAEAVKRHAPDATPLKKACINSCTTALTKIAEPVKSAFRNSYDFGSAAFAKADRTVRLRRRAPGGGTSGAYERIPAEEVEEQFASAEEVEEREGLIATPVKTNSCSHGSSVKSVVYSYGFLTFAKIGYTARIKVVYRIVQWISNDETKSSVSIYATNFAHESDDGGKLILGDRDIVENESNHFFDTRTFTKMVDAIKESMSGPVIKSRIIIYSSILAENVRCYGLQHGLAPDGATVTFILTKTLVDMVIDVVIEKADSREQRLSGSQVSIPGVEMDDKRFSSVFDFLKEKVGIVALSKVLVLVVKEFSAFLRMEPFRTQCHSKRMFTVEYLVLMMGKFLEFVKKRHCGAGFFIIQEIVMAVVRKILCSKFVNKCGFHGSPTKGKKMNKKQNTTKKKK